MKQHITASLFLLALGSGLQAASISVNLTPLPTVDAQRVDSGETSIIGITGTEAIDGANWNDLQLRPSGTSGAPTIFTGNTEGGSLVDLNDSTGVDSGIDLTSTGSFFANFANVSTPNQSATGDAGLMQGYLNMNSSETISLSGLSTWAPSGYQVYAFFDIGPITRTYGVSMNDGTLGQIYWTADSAGTDSDTENDGLIEWSQTTATTSGTAVTDANYAVYGTFTGDTLTISGDATSGRATLSGFQIVAVPEPSTGVLLGTLAMLGLARRRR